AHCAASQTKTPQVRPGAAGSPLLAVRKPKRPCPLPRCAYPADRPAVRSWAGDGLRGGEGEAGGRADPIPAGDQAAAAVHGEDVQVPPAGLYPVGAVAVGEFHPPVQGPGPGAVDNEAAPRTCRADLHVADRPAHHGGAAVIGDEVDVPGQAEQGDVPGQRARARASVDHAPGDAPGAGAGQPALSLPVRFPRLQVISLAVVVSLIVAVPSPSVTAPPGLMVQVAAAAAGPAARPAARQAAMPVSGIRAEREKVGNRIGRAYGGRPDPSRPRPAAPGPRRPFSATSRPAP